MKLFSKLLVLGLALDGVIASSWFSKAGAFPFDLFEFL
jgi:hypothetical protein